MTKLNKGLLSFLSGLGFMGLGFYIIYFTFIRLDNLLLGNYILLFSIVTSLIACAVIYFLGIAFSFTHYRIIKIGTTLSGFIAGSLTLIALILMILSIQVENIGLMKNVDIVERIHPIITFFLGGASIFLLLIPEDIKDYYGDNRL